MSSFKPERQFLMVIDLVNVFYCIPIADHLKELFAFKFHNKHMYHCTYHMYQLPQVFVLLPGIVNSILKDLLLPFVVPDDVAIIQFQGNSSYIRFYMHCIPKKIFLQKHTFFLSSWIHK